ncbi:MAG: M12 family metallo-peptidase [Pseudomonadota bacterium]
MRAVFAIAVGLMSWVVSPGVARAASQMQIKFAEPVTLPAAEGKTQFDAYGRRFALTLESNARLLKAIPAARKASFAQTRVLRGKLDEVPGSWVRLTRVGTRLEGAIWDGNDVYVVASYGSIAGKLTTPFAAAADQTVVYRLSDTLNGLPPEFCGLVDGGGTAAAAGDSGLQQYKGFVAQLRANAATAAVNEALDISLIADKAFQNSAGADATAAMLARLNVVDGIFAEQVGVLLLPTELRLAPSSPDPFTATEAGTLLEQLADYRESIPAVRAAGLAHLMTGKNLDGDTIGIAFVDSLCKAHEGVSLSDSEQGAFYSALVMAHEIGHNFGARHDGVEGVCASTPQNWLMSPTLNGSTEFSACSLSSMAASIAAARGICIGSANYVDVALVLPPSPYETQTTGTFSLPMTLRSIGNRIGTHVELEVTFPSWYSLTGATLAGANCSVASGVITCALADVAVGEERALDLRVTGSTVGSFSVQAVLTVEDDFVTGNNSGLVLVGLQSGVDLGVTITPSVSTAFVNDVVDYTVDVLSRGTQDSHGGRVLINLGGIPIESFNGGPHTCVIEVSSDGILNCQLADIAVGTSTRITLRGRANIARIANGSATLNVPNDSNAGNDQARARVDVSAEREVRISVSTEELRAVIGTSYELTYTLDVVGRLPSQNARFLLQLPYQGVVESVTTPSITCAPVPDFIACDFGTLNPGDVRTVVVRFHMIADATSTLYASARWANGADIAYSGVFTWVYASLAVDVAAVVGNSFGVVEGAIASSAFQVVSEGVNPAQNVTATIELAAPLRLLTLGFNNGPSGWTCALLTSQRGRCTGSFPGGALSNQISATMGFTFVSDTAVDGDATITVTATDDGDPTNNVAHATLQVRPIVDIGISGPLAARMLLTGQTTTVDATITTGRNPVVGARLVPGVADASVALDSLSIGGVDCPQAQIGMPCELGTLPANSVIPVRAVFRAVTGGRNTISVLDVYPDRDSNQLNNSLVVTILTADATDIQLSVAQTSVTANNGAALRFPLITITNGAALSLDITVDIPLPPFVTVNAISSSEILCSGTTTLQCTLLSLSPNTSRNIDIAMTATATGTFTSNVVLRGFNDSTPGNNAVSAVFTVNAAPSSGGGGGGSAGGSGGGGGGRIEWLLLVLLTTLAMRRGKSARG